MKYVLERVHTIICNEKVRSETENLTAEDTKYDNLKKVVYIGICMMSIFILSLLVAFYIDKKWNDLIFWPRVVILFLSGVLAYIIRPRSIFHKLPLFPFGSVQKGLCIFVILVTCILTTYTMTLNYFWKENGLYYHFQYEDQTEAILNGHLYLDIEPSQKLLDMENPYDAGARAQNEVEYMWDHAFYNGHYYMYFGIVPVFVLFIPFRLIGIKLYSYQATQIFVIFIVLGLFILFYEICKYMCRKITLASFIAISIAASYISSWYLVKYPALYCTADAGGICFAVWGFVFCYKAFVSDKEMNNILRDAVLGALFSALVFGCRPTIGFISIAYIPMLLRFFIKKRSYRQFVSVFISFCIPYIIIACLLMLYNYARFENPFEFGQSYQLTIVDQHTYPIKTVKFCDLINGLFFSLFRFENVSATFPYIHHDGVFINFPILFLGMKSFSLTKDTLKGKRMVKGLSWVLIGIVILISCYHVIWAPVIFDRYAMDFNFILCFLMMFGTCKMFWERENYQTLSFELTLFSLYTIVTCFFLFFVSFNYSIDFANGELWIAVRDIIEFWTT